MVCGKFALKFCARLLDVLLKIFFPTNQLSGTEKRLKNVHLWKKKLTSGLKQSQFAKKRKKDVFPDPQCVTERFFLVVLIDNFHGLLTQLAQHFLSLSVVIC